MSYATPLYAPADRAKRTAVMETYRLTACQVDSVLGNAGSTNVFKARVSEEISVFIAKANAEMHWGSLIGDYSPPVCVPVAILSVRGLRTNKRRSLRRP